MKLNNILSPVLLGSIAAFGLTSCGDDKSNDNAGTEEKAKQAENRENFTLRFSAIPDEDTTSQAARYQPVADYLAKKLGVKVEFVASANYGASVEKFRNGDVHLAWFGGVSGVQARDAVSGSVAIASGEADLAFKSYFIANTSTGLTKSDKFPEGIKDLKFTYGSSGSTSGCIMPTSFLMNNTGKGPKEFFTQPFNFSGSHDKTAELVNAGTFQAGALNYKTYDNGVKSGKIDPAKCIVIWETPPFADYNFTAHADLAEHLGADFITDLQDALVNCDDPAVLKALKRKKLVKVNNDTFKGIADVMKKVKF